MVLDEKDVDVSKQIKEHGWYVDEQFDLEVFQKHLKAGMTLVDLGANVGFYTFLGRSLIGKGGRVFSFEPFPRNAGLIRAGIRENGYDNVILVEAAVADRKGKAPFYLSPDANSEHSLLNLDFKYPDIDNYKMDAKPERAIEIDVLTLDSFFEETVGDFKVDFIKMDIEGSEYRAINGMRKIIQNNRDLTMLMEFWPNGFVKGDKDPYGFLKTLTDLGFAINIIDSIDKKIYPIGIEELKGLESSRSKDPRLQNAVMQTWGWYTNLLCIKQG